MPNQLAAETSAYLLQHRDNPVDWHPWGPEAFAKARAEAKPVLVSIGYSSCHWCHVMEHESFEDEAVATRMNELLVCIKVDREERPDIDQIYMDTVVRMTGQGGWPLNVFCTPDGRPFFGGTYFPPQRAHGRPSWLEVVDAVATAFREQPQEVEAQSARMLAALREPPDLETAESSGRQLLSALVAQLMERADRQHGGFGAAPKFPTPTNLEALLCAEPLHAARPGVREHLLFTLQRMARGGIYDQLGGGFHRYSTDALWRVPHFEKMLYDQGQLLRVYAEAYRQSGDPELLWPVEETVAWLEREMRSPEGGFYASQDADSEGEEGRFYVWSPDEIRAVLGREEGEAFAQAYGVSPGGNFEHTGKSVLVHGLAGERPRMAKQRQALFEARRGRVAPDTDRKQIAAWIGYTIGGLATAGASFDRPDWVEAAARAASFVEEHLVDRELGLLRIWDGKRARIPAFLDDHAALLCAYLDLHRAGGDGRWIERALALADAILERFRDPERGALFFAPGDDPTLVFRPQSDSDGATPAAAGMAALGLVRLAELSGRESLRAAARAAIDAELPLAARVPLHLPTLVRAAALLEAGPGLGLVVGDPVDPRTRALARAARRLLGPDDAVAVVAPGERPPWLDPSWLVGREPQTGAPTAWLCRGRACSLPATDPDALALP